MLGMGLFVWSRSRHELKAAPPPKLIKDDEFEIGPDPEEALRESRPRPNLSLQVTGFKAAGSSIRFQFKISDSGRISTVTHWRVFVIQNGKSRQVPAQSNLNMPVSEVPLDGSLTVTPGKGDLTGATWHLGYQDVAGRWRWTVYATH